MNTEILNKIKNTSGTNDKIFLAVSQFKEEEHEFMTECFNRTIYGISETNIGKALGYNKEEHGRLEDIAEFLEIYKKLDVIETTISIKEFINNIIPLSGNEQIKVLNHLIFTRVNSRDRPWYIRVLLKNPRIGISETTYNKIRVQQGLKPLESFYVKLAKLLEPEDFNQLNYPVYAEIKYDGERAYITYNNGHVTIISRNGNDITHQFPEIVSQIKGYFDDTNMDIITLDGEIISKTFNSLQKRMNRLVENINTDNDLKFVCFDITNNQGINIITKLQKDRRNILEFYSKKHNINLSETEIIKTPEELYTFYQTAVERGEEGIIVKDMEAKWALKNNDRELWYKVKPVYTSDLEIYKCEYGKGKNKDKINILYVKDYTERIKSKVSSGMTDDLRSLFTHLNNKEELIGKIIEIKYNSITDTNSLRHPRIIKLRLDKDITDKL